MIITLNFHDNTFASQIDHRPPEEWPDHPPKPDGSTREELLEESLATAIMWRNRTLAMNYKGPGGAHRKAREMIKKAKDNGGVTAAF